MSVTFDSSAWIEYFTGSEKGRVAKEIIDELETIFSPSICLMEIKNKYLREKRKFKSRIDFICIKSQVVDINKETALEAAEIKNRHNLYSVDALIYAVSQRKKSTLLTGDYHFKGLKNVKIL